MSTGASSARAPRAEPLPQAGAQPASLRRRRIAAEARVVALINGGRSFRVPFGRGGVSYGNMAEGPERIGGSVRFVLPAPTRTESDGLRKLQRGVRFRIARIVAVFVAYPLAAIVGAWATWVYINTEQQRTQALIVPDAANGLPSTAANPSPPNAAVAEPPPPALSPAVSGNEGHPSFGEANPTQVQSISTQSEPEGAESEVSVKATAVRAEFSHASRPDATPPTAAARGTPPARGAAAAPPREAKPPTIASRPATSSVETGGTAPPRHAEAATTESLPAQRVSPASSNEVVPSDGDFMPPLR